MGKNHFSEHIWQLFQASAWAKARKLLEAERAKDPQDHWVLTQLGVTFYEQTQYSEALPLFLASLKIVADCPLTLWNLAGTLDALGNHKDAIKIYTWLLESTISAEKDPCWESQKWTDALKTDCAYRLGACFENAGKKKQATQWYRQYLELLLLGADGTYSIEDVTAKIRALHGANGRESNGSQIRKLVHSALVASGKGNRQGRQTPPPRFDAQGTIVGQRVAGRK